MNKSELIIEMSEDNRLSKKDNERALKSFIKIIGETLKSGNKVQIVGFGTYEPRDRAERNRRNPRTREDIIVPASRVPVFRPGKELKEIVNK